MESIMKYNVKIFIKSNSMYELIIVSDNYKNRKFSTLKRSSLYRCLDVAMALLLASRGLWLFCRQCSE